MRRNGRTDANHALIVRELRNLGCTVQSLADIGNGCPDLLVGRRGVNLLLEVKDGTLPPSKKRLTEDERCWHAGWLGQVAVVESVEDVLRLFS